MNGKRLLFNTHPKIIEEKISLISDHFFKVEKRNLSQLNNQIELNIVKGQRNRKYAKMLGFPISLKLAARTLENSVYPFIALCASFGTFMEQTP